MRRVDDPLEDPRDLAYRGFLSRLETKSRAINSDRSHGSNGRERRISLPPILFWKHFHGQRVRNHLGSQVANNDTRSFLRKVSSDLSRAVYTTCIHIYNTYMHTYIRAFKPPFSPVDIDGGHNAETNRVPRRIYMHAIRCARISISIDICPARGLRSTGPGSPVHRPGEKGPTPLSA